MELGDSSSKQLRLSSLQQRMNALSLSSRGEGARQIEDKVLLGKMQSTRLFSRRDLVHIINNAWRTKDRVKVERLNDSMFKFCFSTKEDRDRIYSRRPWSFNGAHLNLKLWNPDLHFERVSFDKSTFFLQIHGLPPNLLNEDNARVIGSEVGVVHEDSISKKSVVNQRYLRFRVDIPVNEAIPAGFVQRTGEGEEYWVQFKFERLADFCYNCGYINHVTGRCSFREPARVTMGSGITARLYGPWLRAEEKGSILFINPATEPEERRSLVHSLESFSGKEVASTKDFHIGESSMREETTEETLEVVTAVPEKDDSESSFQNALAMSPQLESLFVTLKRNSLVKETDLKAAVLMQIRKHDVSIDQLGEWAADLIKVIATAKDHENALYKKYGPDVLEWLGTGPAQFSPPSGLQSNLHVVEPLTHGKRQAPLLLESSEKRQKSVSESEENLDNSEVTNLITALETVIVSDEEETPICFQPGESTPLPISRRRSWKKDARRRGQRRFNQPANEDEAGQTTEEGASSSIRSGQVF